MLTAYKAAGNFQESNLASGGNGRLEVTVQFKEDAGNASFNAPVPELYVNGSTNLPQLTFFSGIPGNIGEEVCHVFCPLIQPVIEIHLCMPPSPPWNPPLARDSCFANDIIVHEFTHAITSSMTRGHIEVSMEGRGLCEGISCRSPVAI